MARNSLKMPPLSPHQASKIRLIISLYLKVNVRTLLVLTRQKPLIRKQQIPPSSYLEVKDVVCLLFLLRIVLLLPLLIPRYFLLYRFLLFSDVSMASPSSSLHIAGNSPPLYLLLPNLCCDPLSFLIDWLGIICHLESAIPCDGAVLLREIYSSAPEFTWALAAQPNEAASLLQNNYDTLKHIRCFCPCGLLLDWSGSCHGCEKDNKRSIIACIAKRETALLWTLQISKKNEIVVQALSFDSIISSISQTTSSCYTLGQAIPKESHLAKWLEKCIKDDWRKLLNCGGPQEFISPPSGSLG